MNSEAGSSKSRSPGGKVASSTPNSDGFEDEILEFWADKGLDEIWDLKMML